MTDEDITRQIQEARRVLAQLNFDAERSNERSALVLLALLGLTPDAAWADATSPRLRTVEIMAWLRNHYGKDYKPNTRETIRRFTLHQFAAALLSRRLATPVTARQAAGAGQERMPGRQGRQRRRHLPVSASRMRA